MELSVKSNCYKGLYDIEWKIMEARRSFLTTTEGHYNGNGKYQNKLFHPVYLLERSFTHVNLEAIEVDIYNAKM